MSELIYWHMLTPDGTVIRSKSRHDYVEHLDKNGKTYMVDGGMDYMRTSANGDEEIFTVTEDDGIEIIRHFMDWGTFGKNGDEPYRRIALIHMTEDHIKACLDTQHAMLPQFRRAMERELKYREQKRKKQYAKG